jgi:hypothetical protein
LDELSNRKDTGKEIISESENIKIDTANRKIERKRSEKATMSL